MREREGQPKARLPLGGAKNFAATARILREGGLATVCREAACPNRSECWDEGVATLMLLGGGCTRGCGFCSVTRDQCPAAPDPDEPAAAALTAQKLNLRHVVLTSVTRDDLADGGAGHFARTVRLVKDLPTRPTVEVLTPDYLGDPLDLVLAEKPEVFAHNLETIRRLTPIARHPRFGYGTSLETLAEAKSLAPSTSTKSSLLLGLGEEISEVLETMEDLREAGVNLLALGQYLRPTPRNLPVAREVAMEEFETLRLAGLKMGFSHVEAGPLVRTSYRAASAYAACLP